MIAIEKGETLGLVAEAYAELGVRSEVEQRGLDALRLEVVARDGIAAVEERSTVDDGT